MKQIRRKTLVGFGVLALTLVLAAPVQAEANFNVEAFRPSPHINDMWTIRTNDAADHLKWRVGLMLNYGSNPLVYRLGSGEDGVVTGQLAADVNASISLWKYLSLGLDIPLFLYNGSDSRGVVGATDVSTFSMGDITIDPKVILLDSKKVGFGVGIALPLTVPSGTRGSFTGEAGVTFTPTLILDMYVKGWKLALNTGYRVRKDQRLSILKVDDEFLLGGGADSAALAREPLRDRRGQHLHERKHVLLRGEQQPGGGGPRPAVRDGQRADLRPGRWRRGDPRVRLRRVPGVRRGGVLAEVHAAGRHRRRRPR